MLIVVLPRIIVIGHPVAGEGRHTVDFTAS